MTAKAVRTIVMVVCGVGVAGMIVTTVLDHNGAALTFGLLSAVAILCLMVATAVTAHNPPSAQAPEGDVEAQGAQVEAVISSLVASGADEATVRRLVREAVRLGQERAAAAARADEHERP